MANRASVTSRLALVLLIAASLFAMAGHAAAAKSARGVAAPDIRDLVADALERWRAGGEIAGVVPSPASDVVPGERVAVAAPESGTAEAGRDGPILTSDDFFHDIGDYYRSWSNDSNVSVSGLLGLPGGPQTWDFTGGPTAEIKRFDYVATNDGDDPGAGFYAADHFADADFSQRMTEEIGSDRAWMYLDQLPAVGRMNYGFYWPDGNPLTDDWSVFTPSILDFPDPLEWGDSWLLSTTYQFQMYDLGEVLDVRVDLTVDADADAWGTVFLPSLGPVDALRVNTEQTSAIYVWLSGTWLPVGTQFIRIYDWIGVDSDIVVEIGSTVSDVSMPPDQFTIASIFVRQFENSNPTAAPVIADIPDTTLLETYVEFTYDVEASGIPDPTFSLFAAPSGMTIDEITGLIEWTPTSAEVGVNTVIVEADNGQGTDTEEFAVTVVNTNESPENLWTELFDEGITVLSWDPPASTYWLAGYEVRHSTDTGGPYALVAEVGPYDLSVELPTPGFSQTNYYVVTATLEVGREAYESASSNEVLAYSLGPSEAGCGNDDGSAESGHQAGGQNGEMAASLDLPGPEELTLTKVAVYLTECVGAPITMKVSADDAGGYPGSSLAQAQYPAGMLRQGWNILEIPEFMQPSFTGGSFFVGLVEGTTNNTVGLDEGSYGHSFTKAPGGAWSFMFSGELMFRGIVEDDGTGVDDSVTASAFALLGNSPNPFNPATRIEFDLPETAAVTLEVYSAAGRRVATLVDRTVEAGRHHVVWRGVDGSGRALPSGVYLARLSAGEEAAEHRMVLLK
jgi:hypothetical protein